MGMSGCAKQMAKQDSGTPPPASQTNQQKDHGQTKAAAAAPTPTKTSGTDASAGGDKQMVASSASPQPEAKVAIKADKKDPSAQEAAAATKLSPLPPKRIVDTINTLTNLHRARYLSRTAQYDFYVGGKIDAKYDLGKSQLIVTNAPAHDKNSVTCDYAKNGEMVAGKKAIPAHKVEECNKLIHQLDAYMTE
ncbi:MAG: hypothetical protein P8079_00415 [Gammaproteobacteria bacterium]